MEYWSYVDCRRGRKLQQVLVVDWVTNRGDSHGSIPVQIVDPETGSVGVCDSDARGRNAVSPQPRKAALSEIGAHFADSNGFTAYRNGSQPGVGAWATYPRRSTFTTNAIQHNVANGRQIVLQVEPIDGQVS